MTGILFEHKVNNTTQLKTCNFLIVLNRLMNDKLNTSDWPTSKINIILDENVIDTLSWDPINTHNIASLCGKIYNTLNIESMTNLMNDYINLTEPSYNNLLRTGIYKHCTSNTTNNNTTSTNNTTNNILTTLPSVDNDVMDNSNINNSANNNLYVKNNGIKIYELSEDEMNMLSNMSNLEIEKTIEKLEEINGELKEEIDNTEYNKEVNENKIIRKEKAEKKMKEEKYNIFLSDKSYTYCKIYADFFIEKRIKSWDGIPELFIVKFAILLYMDGKNTEGENVRDKILETDREYEIYNILYDSLTNENFIPPEDENTQKMVEDFINTLPPIQIVTENDIMAALNDPDDPIFNCETSSQCSVDEDDYKNSSYVM